MHRCQNDYINRVNDEQSTKCNIHVKACADHNANGN